MVKKVFLVAMGVLLCLSGFTFAAGKTEEKTAMAKPEALKIASVAWPSMKEVQLKLFSLYEKAKGVQIKYIDVGSGGMEGFWQYMKSRFASGDLPDIEVTFAGATTWERDNDILTGGNHYVNFDDYLEQSNPYAGGTKWKDLFVEGIFDNPGVKFMGADQKSHVWAIPFDKNMMVLFMCRDILKEAGAPESFNSYGELTAAMDKVKALNKNYLPYTYNPGSAYWYPSIWLDQVWRELEPKIDTDRDKAFSQKEAYSAVKNGIVNYDDPAWKEVMLKWKTFVDKYFPSGWRGRPWTGEGGLKTTFVTKQTAFFRDNSWFATDPGVEQKGFDWVPGIQLAPGLTTSDSKYVKGTARTTNGAGFVLMVLNNKNKETSIDFLKYITAPDTVKSISDQALLMVPIKGIEFKGPNAARTKDVEKLLASSPVSNPWENYVFLRLTEGFDGDARNAILDFMEGKIDITALSQKMNSMAQATVKELASQHPDW
ncbi:MAG: hypothetical protein AB1798_18970 [Spirochaetota bacterium]